MMAAGLQTRGSGRQASRWTLLDVRTERPALWQADQQSRRPTNRAERLLAHLATDQPQSLSVIGTLARRVYRFGVAMGGADLGPGCGPAFALGADHAPDTSSFGHVGAVLDLSRHAVALAGVQCNGGCPATETLCGRAVRCGLGGIQACRAEQQRTPKRSREARWNFTGVLLRG